MTRVTRRHSTAPADGGVVGNRYVLAGAVLYLMEFVAIAAIGAAGTGPVVGRDLTPDDLSAAYVGHVDVLAFMAGWLAVVLLGRVLVFVGLRKALGADGPHPLLDLAVLTAAVSVALEVAGFGLVMAAAERAAAEDRVGTVLLHQAGLGVGLTFAGGLGSAVLCATYVMGASGQFPVGLVWLGWLAGAGTIAAQLTIAPAAAALSGAFQASLMLFWVWMLWAGVLLWRRTPATVDR